MNPGKAGPPSSPLLVRAVELCNDGGWHNYEAVIAELMRMVEPGKAMRRAERDRLASGGPPQRTKGSLPRVMASGQRSIVRDFVRSPYFEVKPHGHVPKGVTRQVRLAAVPPRVAYERRKAEQERRRHPNVLIPLLLGQELEEVHETLRNLDGPHLRRLCEALVAYAKVGESNWAQW